MKPSSHLIKESLLNTRDKVRSMAQSTAESLHSGFDRLLDRRVCLGVTGFSGSGKTTLMTSLIHQLRYYPDAALAALPPALQNRLLGVEVSNLYGLPLFPYQAGIDALSSGSWPDATRRESSCLLEIKYRVRRNILSRNAKGTGRLFLEIHDYPGEWLLDLPLLTMSYLDWCQQYHQLLQKPSFLQHDFLKKITELDPLQPASEFSLNALWQLQLDYLMTCQQQGFTLLQPGRLLHAKPDSPESHTPFIPLPTLADLTSEQRQKAPANALFRLCEQHYQHYLEQWVRPFYQQTFQKVERQVVLVDVLRGLNQGEQPFNDLCISLSQVLQSFDYGHNSLIRRLFNPRVDRVVFAASKIDQVLPEQHESIRNLTASLVREAQRRATFNNIDVRCEAVAGIRSTTHVEHQGQTVLKGNTEEGPGLLRHPPVPEHIPTTDEWQNRPTWQLRRLLPPTNLKLQQGGQLPHIRLDSLLNDLLGDKFL